MRRRNLFVLLAGAALGQPLASGAEQITKRAIKGLRRRAGRLRPVPAGKVGYRQQRLFRLHHRRQGRAGSQGRRAADECARHVAQGRELIEERGKSHQRPPPFSHGAHHLLIMLGSLPSVMKSPA